MPREKLLLKTCETKEANENFITDHEDHSKSQVIKIILEGF